MKSVCQIYHPSSFQDPSSAYDECASSLQWAKEDYVKLLLISLHWLPVAARIRFKALKLPLERHPPTSILSYECMILLASHGLASLLLHNEVQSCFPKPSLSLLISGGKSCQPLSDLLRPSRLSRSSWKPQALQKKHKKILSVFYLLFLNSLCIQ